MLKKWLVGLVSCAAIFGVGGVSAEKIDFDQGVDVKSVIESIQSKVAAETAADKAKAGNWTIMVYVNAKNNLEKFGMGDVNEMEKVGSTDKVKIVVELGRIKGYDSSDGDWKGQRRYIVKKDADAAKITSPVLQDIPKADMGDYKHLVEFVNWSRQKAPAQHYMLIVWNHGSGWDKKRSDVALNGISYDDETGNHITTIQLGQALAAMGKIDIYASDACLMQMAEVGYQIRNHTDYIVGSEETEPGDGYTYDTFLGPVVAKPAMTAAEVAKQTARAYTAHYAQQGEGATQSVVKSAALGKLLSLVSGWADAVMAANDTALLKTVRGQTQSFYTSANKDLLHFVNLMVAGTKDAAVKSQGTALADFLAREVIVDNAVAGSDYKNAAGLAIYIPDYGYDAKYDELAWTKEGSWGKFAKWQKDIRDESQASR